MTKKIEKIASLVFFLLMFVFLNQLEAGILPFFVAISGIVSCGGLAVVFLMHGAELSFKLDFADIEDTEPITQSQSQTAPYPSINPDIVGWYHKTNAA